MESDKGVLDRRKLPHNPFAAQWDAVIVPQEVKDRLLSQAILNFTLRPKFANASLPLHGVILLVGPPGTGKTSLGRGLATRCADAFSNEREFHYIEVEPHALASAALGRSQQAVRHLLGTTIAEQAARGPLIVLLDEVETLAPDRTKLSLESNPVDVHRATDAVLAQLDFLAGEHPSLMFIATSNFPQAIDAAFSSRADLVEFIDLPNNDARLKIIKDTLLVLAKQYPKMAKLAADYRLGGLAEECEGLDGRRLRKVVISACAVNKQTALDPQRLTFDDLRLTLKQCLPEKSVRK